MKLKLVKTITLLTFIGLITVFVLYRTGKSKVNQPENHEEILKKNEKKDPTTNLESEKIPSTASSSEDVKSPEIKHKIRVDNSNKALDSIPKQKWQIMPSSKSAIMFEPEIEVDSSKFIKP